jgi:hypothetical protein
MDSYSVISEFIPVIVIDFPNYLPHGGLNAIDLGTIR